jgi:amino acid adenylation domain-containing protein
MPDTDRAREDRIRRALDRSRSRFEAPTPRSDPTAPTPITAFQEGLWYNAVLAGESGESSDPRPAAFLISGPLDRSALVTAIHEVQRRHAILRSVFRDVDGVPMQIATDELADVEVHDLGHIAEADRLEVARGMARDAALAPFDLQRQAPFRPHLFRLTDDRHLLAICMHHIVFDGWSAGVLRWELEWRYAEAIDSGREPPEPVNVDAADVVSWRRSRGSSDEVERDVAYWRDRLAGVSGELELPREATEGSEGFPGPITIDLPEASTRAIRDLARETDATTFMVLLAVAEVLAARLSGQDDFAVSVVAAGRDETEAERLIGCFINMMLLPARFTDETTFRDVVTAVRGEVYGGLAHQQAPFARVVHELARPTGAAPSNLLVQMRRFPALPGTPSTPVVWEPFELHLPAAAALMIEGTEIGAGLRVSVNHDVSRISRETALRWCSHLERVLESALSDPDRAIWDLDLLSDSERHQVTTSFNEPMELPVGPLVTTQIASMADQVPHVVAFEDRERSLTYRELSRAAYGVAANLIDRGVGRGRRVVLFLEPGLDAAIAVLGALWSGATYVPVDPSVSSSWLAGIVEQTEPTMVITHRARLTDLDDLGANVVALDDLTGSAVTPPAVEVGGDDIAYICFTSGSTGAPKGVLITHANVSAVLANQTYCRYGPGDRVLQMYSISFDGFVTGLLGPLVSGASCVLYDRGALDSASSFLAWCTDHRISHMGIPTSLFHTLVDEMEPAGETFPDTLEHIAIGGEEVRVDAVEAFHRIRHPAVRLHNTYGPTETTVWVLRKDLTQAPDPAVRRISIGTPVPNASVHILDRRDRPTPIGVAGELHIGGSQVGAGYLDRPDLTVERFIPDPFSPVPDARLYRTGDLARWLPDGEVDFLGRIDRQVKIRGFRVEPEAVEKVLRDHPSVVDVAVVDARAPDGSIVLRAYLVVDGEPPGRTELRRWCLSSLPEFTVPSSFTVLDALPRTVSRKLDRRRLPEPASSEPRVHRERTAAEATVAEIWCDVLGIEQIDDGADFFSLGGHSLIAMRIIGRVKRAFDVDIPLSSIFDHPTLRDFTDYVERAAHDDPVDVASLLEGLDALDPAAVAAILAELEGDG